MYQIEECSDSESTASSTGKENHLANKIIQDFIARENNATDQTQTAWIIMDEEDSGNQANNLAHLIEDSDEDVVPRQCYPAADIQNIDEFSGSSSVCSDAFSEIQSIEDPDENAENSHPFRDYVLPTCSVQLFDGNETSDEKPKRRNRKHGVITNQLMKSIRSRKSAEHFASFRAFKEGLSHFRPTAAAEFDDTNAINIGWGIDMVISSSDLSNFILKRHNYKS